MKSKLLIFETNQTFFDSLKYFIKRILHRSRYNYKLSTNLNLNLDGEKTYIKKLKSKILLKKKIFITTLNGFFYIENGKLYNIIKNNAFHGIARYKNKFFLGCIGLHHSQGCIVSFDYTSNKIKNLKSEYKIREQCFHGMQINKGNLYVVNSTWRYKLDEILKFKIRNNSLELEKKIKPRIDYPFIHLNTIFFKGRSILFCYHNMTQVTKMPSQICEFDNKWKFVKIIETENLSSAHNVSIINKKLSILDSANGLFLLGKEKFNFPGKFLRGIDYDKKNYYIGLNSIKERVQRVDMSPQLGIIDKKTKKISTVLLPKMGAICSIMIVD